MFINDKDIQLLRAIARCENVFKCNHEKYLDINEYIEYKKNMTIWIYIDILHVFILNKH